MLPSLVSNLVLTGQPAVAAAAEAETPWYEYQIVKLALVAGVFLVPLVLAQMLAGMTKMRDYMSKFYAIFFAITAGLFVVLTGQFRLDIDLAGGTILIYELDQSELTAEKQIDMTKMIAALRQRIDPAGVKQTRLRPYGTNQVEIIVPEVDQTEIDQLKRQISSAGELVFRITADVAKDNRLIERAYALPKSQTDIRDRPTLAVRGDTFADPLIELAEELPPSQSRVRRESDGTVAEWVPRKELDLAQQERLKDDKDLVFRNGKEEVLLIKDRLRARWVPVGVAEDPVTGEKSLRIPETDAYVFRHHGPLEADALVVMDPMNVTGEYLTSALAQPDPQGGWQVNFSFNAPGAERFGRLTAANQEDPETGRKRNLAIILDDELLSAPSLNAIITDSGQITGNFSDADAQWLASVLDAGSLPAALAEKPIREERISNLLGQETIEKGTTAIAVSFGLVLVFMIVYYRFCGLVACFAVTLNLLLVVAIMMLFKARFSLPGLAGLVLTVGMAVDANVLIFERIREELNRGATLRMAIRNGFDRATRTIVDANVTTLITGLVLYVIGSEQIRGFAVTLILGIAMSMFAAIFCSRVIFEVAEKRRWIQSLKMMRLFGETNFDFLGRRRLAAVASIALIVLGLVAVFDRGADMLAIDFTGGTKVQVVAKEQLEEGTAREMLMAASQEYAEANSPKDVRISEFTQLETANDDGHRTTLVLTSTSHPRAALGVARQAFPEASDIKSRQDNSVRVALTESLSREDADRQLAVGMQAYQSSITLDPNNTQVRVPSQEEQHVVDGETTTVTVHLIEVETGLPDIQVVRETVEQAFPGGLKSNQLHYDPAALETIAAATPDDEATDVDAPLDAGPDTGVPGDDAAPGTDETSQLVPRRNLDPAAIKPPSVARLTAAPVLAQPAPDDTPEETAPEETAPEEASPEETAPAAEPTSPPADDLVPQPESAGGVDSDPPLGGAAGADPLSGGAGAETTPDVVPFAGGTRAELTFDIALNQQTLTEYIQDVMRSLDLGEDSRAFLVSTEDVEAGQSNVSVNWRFESGLNKERTQTLLDAVAAKMQTEPVFRSADSFGSQVAGDQQKRAFGALAASLIFIVGYIWIRFQRVVFGFAAVVALVHDVLITLGVLALSGYVAQIGFFHNFLLIDRFKISLEILAAFLTIIGYSLNDTIVVFDRIREVRGKSPDLTAGMINKSINQTLSRTVLTSLTTLIVVAILYAGGGSGIHGFAFALVTGVLVGTYSSIFVASPVLLWLSRTSLSVSEELAEKYPAGAAAT